VILFILLILGSMGILGIYLVNFIRDTQIDSLRSQLEQDARLVAEAALPALSDTTKVDNVAVLAREFGKKINVRVTIVAPSGVVLGDSEQDPSIMGNHAARPEVVDAIKSGIGDSVYYIKITGQRMMYVAVPIASQGQIMGVASVGLSLATIESSLNRVTTTIVLSIVIIIILAIIAATLIARAITRPLRQLTRAAQKIAAGELDQHINLRASGEAGQIAQAFNEMSLKLRERVKGISDERNKLVAVLSSMADGVIMTDTERIIVMTNRAARRLFNLPEDKIGQRLIHGVHDYEIDQVVQLCLNTSQEHTMQVEFGPDKRFLRVIAVPLGNAKLTGALLLLQDLTELRSLQTMRRELVGNVSHELRTPLAAIKAMVETLQNGAVSDIEVATDFLSRIDAEVDKMTHMVGELTELSRIETGQARLNLELTDINQLVIEATIRLMPQAGRQQVALLTKLYPELPLVGIDREQIQQVILNLAHNAIKFTPAGGRITVSTEIQQDSVIISIVDTGIGISKEDLPHVFERFYKADKARSGGGTGLGLAIARHIIQAHGGSIQVSSQEGEGSTFSFRLPLRAN
jgi:two-component system phosphate regulon sensor histidine kinase PhoR